MLLYVVRSTEVAETAASGSVGAIGNECLEKGGVLTDDYTRKVDPHLWHSTIVAGSVSKCCSHSGQVTG